jgi:hypothetical protein
MGWVKSKAVLLNLIVVSGIYIYFYFLLAQYTQACKPEAGAVGFIAERVSCRSLNELGDALSGAFAPVAFIWLFGAVLIQSQELEAQREELRDTRKVMAEQVAEARASTGLFKEQTAILVRQQAANEQNIADEKFEKLFETLTYIVSQEGETWFIFNLYDKAHLEKFGYDPERIQPLGIGNLRSQQSTREGKWWYLRRTLSYWHEQLVGQRDIAVITSFDRENDFYFFMQNIVDMGEIVDSMSPGSQVFAAGVKVKDTAELARDILKIIRNFPRREGAKVEDRYTPEMRKLFFELSARANLDSIEFSFIQADFLHGVFTTSTSTPKTVNVILHYAEVNGANAEIIKSVARSKYREAWDKLFNEAI